KYGIKNTKNIYVINEISNENKEILYQVIAPKFIEVITGNEFDLNDSKKLEQINYNAIKSYYKKLGIDIYQIQTSYIKKTGFIMILATIIGAASSIFVGFFSSKIAAGASKNLRKDIFTKVLSFTNNEYDKYSSSTLITRCTNDISQIQTTLIMILRMLLYAPLMGIGGVIKALDKSVSMSWIIALGIVILFGFIMITFSIVMPKFKLIQKVLDKINLITREQLSGMLVIRGFNNQDFEEKRFDKTNKNLTKLNLFVNRIMSFLFPMMILIMNLTSLLIIWVSAKYIANSSMRVGDMIAFMQYAIQIMSAFLMLSMMFMMIPRASVSALRIYEVLNTNISIKDPKQPKEFDSSMKADIVFENVYFKYDGANEYMLKDINFKIKEGETTAIIGSTGSGKTTLINLIMRFYDPDKGKIKIKNQLINEVKQKDLRELIGYIPQKSMLFSGTVESNLKYGNSYADDKLINNSIKTAQATNFINSENDGMKRHISQMGKNISGGQKQRVSIARALVKNSPIYIFDDSFSQLDYKTDSMLRNDLNKTTINKTIIIIAQRISTVKNADQILVMDSGKIVGSGKHNYLISNCEVYKEIANSQLSKGEF
ncbi:ABC transporter ATP-binding protein, partial [Clostridiaceae bacterium HSG29]|nr:ABC transporter ATP-binding protein [Clostridiaceae bacterium HSG29]